MPAEKHRRPQSFSVPPGAVDCSVPASLEELPPEPESPIQEVASFLLGKSERGSRSFSPAESVPPPKNDEAYTTRSFNESGVSEGQEEGGGSRCFKEPST